jgi:hypothetical protein
MNNTMAKMATETARVAEMAKEAAMEKDRLFALRISMEQDKAAKAAEELNARRGAERRRGGKKKGTRDMHIEDTDSDDGKNKINHCNSLHSSIKIGVV